MRLLMVGMGRIGRFWVERMVPQVPEVELVACVDIDHAALEALGKRVPVPAERLFTSLTAALEAARPDAVVVTATLDSHVAVARAALEAGCPPLTRKPSAPSLAGAQP